MEYVPAAVAGLAMAGAVANLVRIAVKGTRQVNAHLDTLQQDYQQHFPKEELIPFYEDLITNVRPNLMGKRRMVADVMTFGLEEQIMNYATMEVQKAIGEGTVLDFNNSVETVSPTYRQAIEALELQRTEESRPYVQRMKGQLKH